LPCERGGEAVFYIISPKCGKLAAKGPSPELVRLQKLQMMAAKMGLFLSVIILLITGFATAL